MTHSSSSVATGRLRYWISRLAAVLFGIIFAFVLMEALFRVRVIAYNLPENLQASLREVRVTPWREDRIVPPSLLRPDNYFQIAIRPGATNDPQLANTGVQYNVTTLNWLDPNSHMGFRVDRPDWEPRWPVDAVIVGDSFTWCQTEFADCYTEILAHDHNLSLVNLGVPGTGSVSHQRVLNTFGMAFQPKLVIWQWCGNDYDNDYNLAVMSGLIKPQTPVVESQVVPQQPFANWLFNHSAIYALMRTLLVTPEPVNVPTRHLQSGDLDLYFDQPDIGINIKYSSKSVQLGWPLTRPAITGARDALKDQGIQFLVVLIPTKEEVYQHYLEAELGKAWFEDASKGRQLMLDLCQEEGLTCLDVTEDLMSFADKGEQIYWPTDFHINERGNQIVADAIWRYIDEHKLLAQP